LREKFEATEIRRRILEGEDWKELVPHEVYEYVREIDGDGRINDLARTDTINDKRRQ
jgi:nicotinamide-nucleotide adenylyltransferase